MKITYPNGIEKDLETATHYIGVTMTLTGVTNATNEYKGVEEPVFVFIGNNSATLEEITFCTKSKSLVETGKALIEKAEGFPEVRLMQRLSEAGRRYYIFEEVRNIEEKI